jgi:hypothetical protein
MEERRRQARPRRTQVLITTCLGMLKLGNDLLIFVYSFSVTRLLVTTQLLHIFSPKLRPE